MFHTLASSGTGYSFSAFKRDSPLIVFHQHIFRSLHLIFVNRCFSDLFLSSSLPVLLVPFDLSFSSHLICSGFLTLPDPSFLPHLTCPSHLT